MTHPKPLNEPVRSFQGNMTIPQGENQSTEPGSCAPLVVGTAKWFCRYAPFPWSPAVSMRDWLESWSGLKVSEKRVQQDFGVGATLTWVAEMAYVYCTLRALLGGEVPYEDASQMVGEERLQRSLAIVIQQQQDRPLMENGCWLTEEQYLQKLLSVPESGFLSMASQESLAQEGRKVYRERIRAAIVSGAVDWATGLRLGGIEHVGDVLLPQIEATAYTLGCDPYLDVCRALVMGVTESRLRDRHKNLVREALNTGKSVPQAVLNEYPGLVAQFSPEDFPVDEFIRALRSDPLLFSEPHLLSTHASEWEARAAADLAQRKKPHSTVYVEKVLGTVNFAVLKRIQFLLPSERRLRGIHATAVKKAVQAGKTLKPEVLAAYPDLQAGKKR